MNIGKMIKKHRTNMGLTQKELAEKVKCAVGTIQQYELEKRQPSLEQLGRIAFALDVNVSDLLGEINYVNMTSTDDGAVLNKMSTLIEDIQENMIINYYRQLNDIGKREAMKRIGELTLMEHYIGEPIKGVRFLYKDLDDEK